MKHQLLRLLCTAVLAAAIIPASVPVASAQSSGASATDRHVFRFGNVPGNFAAQVAAAGGSILRQHDEIGVVVTTGLTDPAASGLGGNGVRDYEIQWVPGELSSASVHDLPGAGGAGHDPTDAFFYQNGLQWDMEIIDADDAWIAGFSADPSIRVAVIDSGIDPFHADLAGLIDAGSSIAYVAYGTDASGTCATLASIFPPSVPQPAWADDRYHGTHVAGTIATNGIGTSGVAPHATLIAVKVLSCLGSGSFSDIIAGIVHSADVGADVINMSLGVPGGIPKNLPGVGQLNAAVNKAVNYAKSRGALVVSASGNDGIDMQHAGNVLFTPCENGSGMCVSATDITDNLTAYSNFGNTISVSAPGGDGVAPVLSPCASDSVFLPAVGIGCGTLSYLFLTGTSMATPHVSGVAALLAAQAPANPAQLRATIQQTADDLGKKGNDPAHGKGRVNACRAVGC